MTWSCTGVWVGWFTLVALMSFGKHQSIFASYNSGAVNVYEYYATFFFM